MNWFSTTRWYCPLRGVEFYFHSSAEPPTRIDSKPSHLLDGVGPLVHVLAWRFAQGIQYCVSATFLRQIASDVMSHAQTPAKRLFWGMHGLVLETSIWLLAESTRSQLCSTIVWITVIFWILFVETSAFHFVKRTWQKNARGFGFWICSMWRRASHTPLNQRKRERERLHTFAFMRALTPSENRLREFASRQEESQKARFASRALLRLCSTKTCELLWCFFWHRELLWFQTHSVLTRIWQACDYREQCRKRWNSSNGAHAAQDWEMVLWVKVFEAMEASREEAHTDLRERKSSFTCRAGRCRTRLTFQLAFTHKRADLRRPRWESQRH